MTGKYRYLLTVLSLVQIFFAFSAYSQNRKIDSLNSLLTRYELRKKADGRQSYSPADSVKVNLLDKVALAYSELEPEKSREAAEAQLTLARRIGYDIGTANALNTLGIYYEYKGNYKRSVEFYQAALDIAKRRGFKDLELHVLGNIALNYGLQGIYTEALRIHQEILIRAKEAREELTLLITYNNIGTIYKTLKKNEEALPYFQKALDLQLKQKKPHFIAQTYSNIAHIYRLDKKYTPALAYLQKGLESATKENNINSMADTYSGIGRVYADLRDYDKALVNFQKARDLREHAQNGYGLCISYISLGDIYLKKGDSKTALDYTLKAQELVKDYDDLQMQIEVYRQLSAIHEATGNYKSAFENLTMFKKLNDSVFNADNNRKLVEQQLNFDFKNIQDRKDLIAKQEAERNANTRNYIIIIASLVVLFLIVLLFQRNKIAKTRRQQALQAERNRINRDLHDSLGAQLSTVRMYVSGIQNTDSGVAETIDNTLGLLDDSIHELRRIMNDEDSTILQKQGLIGAISTLATKVHHLHHIHFSLNYNFDGKLPDRIEHELYRILQELINNTLKYAEAANITIELIQRDGKITLLYEDDGKGFEPDDVIRGNGLSNITFRATQSGGSSEIDSKPGHGARCIIEIPLSK